MLCSGWWWPNSAESKKNTNKKASTRNGRKMTKSKCRFEKIKLCDMNNSLGSFSFKCSFTLIPRYHFKRYPDTDDYLSAYFSSSLNLFVWLRHCPQQSICQLHFVRLCVSCSHVLYTFSLLLLLSSIEPPIHSSDFASFTTALCSVINRWNDWERNVTTFICCCCCRYYHRTHPLFLSIWHLWFLSVSWLYAT